MLTTRTLAEETENWNMWTLNWFIILWKRRSNNFWFLYLVIHCEYVSAVIRSAGLRTDGRGARHVVAGSYVTTKQCHACNNRSKQSWLRPNRMGCDPCGVGGSRVAAYQPGNHPASGDPSSSATGVHTRYLSLFRWLIKQCWLKVEAFQSKKCTLQDFAYLFPDLIDFIIINNDHNPHQNHQSHRQSHDNHAEDNWPDFSGCSRARPSTFVPCCCTPFPHRHYLYLMVISLSSLSAMAIWCWGWFISLLLSSLLQMTCGISMPLELLLVMSEL